MRAESLKKTVYAAGSRAIAGCVLDTLIVNLPGSPRGAVDCLGFVARPARHVLDLIAGSSRTASVRNSRSSRKLAEGCAIGRRFRLTRGGRVD